MKRILLTGMAVLGAVSLLSAQQASHSLLQAEKAQHEMIKPMKTQSFSNNAQAKVAASAPAIWSEDFANGIPSSWTFGGWFTGTSGVTSFPDMSQATPVYGWEYRGVSTTPDTATGTQGAYGSNRKIDSPTMANGWIIFDSDFLDNAGTPGNFGNGVAPTPHIGTLTTDTIDFSMYSDLQIEMNSYIRTFFGEAMIAFSTDGGASFPDTVKLHADLDVNEANEADGIARVKISDYVGGAQHAMIQFIFEGATAGNTNGTGYYFWQIDDISISEVPANDVILTGTDIFFDNDDIANLYYGNYELRDFYGQMPLSQMDSLNFGFLVQNYGTNVRTDVTNTIDCSLDGTPVHNLTTATDTFQQDTEEWYYHFASYLPAAEGDLEITYTVGGDSTEATPDNNTTSFNMLITEHEMNPYYPGTMDIDVIGSGQFTGGDDGLILGNVISLVTAQELTYVKVGLHTSSNASYNTIPGGSIKIMVVDTFGLANQSVATSVANYLMQSGNYTITDADTAQGFCMIEIPSVYVGTPQNRTLNPGSYVLGAIITSNGNANTIMVKDDLSVSRRAMESLIFIPSDKWYSNGNAFNIGAMLDYVSTVEEAEEVSQLSAYPNPSSGEFTINFSTSSKTTANIIVRDVTGKVVYTNETEVAAGRHQEKVSLDALSNGVYLYEVKTANDNAHGKVVLTK